ncbi:hypothetical protein L1049_002237 [Liquidambar formosana]|uniref:Tetraspanin n=1 Tax=Liquidambar formosana TaxID=63359 RepID=A0AAP0R6I3_LIQFO
MFGVSNGLLGFLNFLTLFLSMPIIGIAWTLQLEGQTECEKLLRIPMSTLGIFLLVVSIMGLIGSCCQSARLLKIYLGLMLLLLLGIFCFMILTVVVTTNKDAGVQVMGKGYREYRLEESHGLLKRLVMDDKYWPTFKSCIIDSQVCLIVADHALLDAIEFDLLEDWPPVESGCCKPPTYCGFEYRNSTFWAVPKSGLASKDHDCLTWRNRGDTLCYNCNSCKAGFLANLNDALRDRISFNICFLIFLIFILTIGWQALRNSLAGKNTKQKCYA